VDPRRTLVLIAAIALGALASLGILNYVRGVEGSVRNDTETAVAWVVKEGIPKGTPAETVIERKMIVETVLPANLIPSTAVVDPDAELASLVAVADLPANQTLVSGAFVVAEQATSDVTDRLALKGMVTVTFDVSKANGVAHLIEPGDYVNVLSLLERDDLDNAGRSELGLERNDLIETIETVTENTVVTDELGTYGYLSRYVYQKAEVLAVDRTLTLDLGESEQEQGQATTSGLITLAVPPEAVQMILNVGIDRIYLSLVSADYEPRALPSLDLLDTQLPGEDPQRLTPSGPTPDKLATVSP